MSFSVKSEAVAVKEKIKKIIILVMANWFSFYIIIFAKIIWKKKQERERFVYVESSLRKIGFEKKKTNHYIEYCDGTYGVEFGTVERMVCSILPSE